MYFSTHTMRSQVNNQAMYIYRTIKQNQGVSQLLNVRLSHIVSLSCPKPEAIKYITSQRQS